MTPEMKRIQDEIRSNNADALKDSVRRMFPEREFSDDALERCSSLLKVASLLGLDPKKLLQTEVDKLPRKDEHNLAFSNIGYPIPGCKFGYTYGSHPDATDAQIAAEMEKGGNSTKSGGKLKAGKTNDKPEPQVKEPDPNKELIPDKSRKPSSKERQRDINRLRDLLLMEAGTPEEMEAVAASVINRYQSPGSYFGIKGSPKNYSDVINAYPVYHVKDKDGNVTDSPAEQYKGFGNGATPAEVEKIKNQAAQKLPNAIEKLKNASEIAEKAVDKPDSINRTMQDENGNSHYIYGVRTAGTEKPGGKFQKIEHGKAYGNDYYYVGK